MKKFLYSAIFYFSFLFVNCNNNNPVSPSDIYFPQIQNAWRDSKNNDHTISFATDDVNVSFGIFNGRETIPGSFDQPLLYGAFNNRDVEFIIQRLDGDVKFKGRFTTDTTMQLQSSNNESLLLIKGIL